jgi:hypothetical protein
LSEQQRQGLHLCSYFFTGEDMTEEDIIKLAIDNTIHGLKFDEKGLLRFANLVASAEREACAKIVDENLRFENYLSEIIRARGQA